MGDTTSNFGLYRPDAGEDDWATLVNDNFDTIDTNLTDERIEDLVDTLLSAGASITLTYDDANDDLEIAVDETTIDHDALTNFVANKHIDHSTTNVIAGTLLTGGGSIDSDVTLNVDEGNIDHDNLTNFVTNEHIDHSSVNVTAGAGLTGGGDITATRTLDAQQVTTQTTNYTASENDIVLADASGGPITITLPSPSTDINVTVKKIDSSSNSVTIATPASETIDGDSSRTVTAQYVSRTITSDGSNYFII